MPKNILSLKPRELIKLLEKAGCKFYIEGKGDHCLYTRKIDEVRKVVPIDIGAGEMSPDMCYVFLGNLVLRTQKLKTY